MSDYSYPPEAIRRWKDRVEDLERGTRLLVQEHNEELADMQVRAYNAEAKLARIEAYLKEQDPALWIDIRNKVINNKPDYDWSGDSPEWTI